MAVIHRAQLSPTKPELVTAWLDAQPWGGSGEVEMIGGYRMDDPAGEVGIEGLLARRGDAVFHVPLTYRGAPLDPDEEGGDGTSAPALVTTMEHSALGPRWVYLASADPVALDCYARVFFGEAEQADVQRLLPDGSHEPVESVVSVHVEGDAEAYGSIVFTGAMADAAQGAMRLVATWPGGSGVVAALG